MKIPTSVFKRFNLMKLKVYFILHPYIERIDREPHILRALVFNFIISKKHFITHITCDF